MPARSTTHPSAAVLAAFGQGKLDSAASEAILTHLDACPQCCEAVAKRCGEKFLERLRAASGRGGIPRPTKSSSSTASDLKGAEPGPAAAHDDQSIPSELRDHPQYQVVRELGRGGMGVVYLATNKLMQRLEVLKVMNRALLDREGAVERFLREIRAAAMLNHPNVATAYTALQAGDLFVFAMEYVEGEDLAQAVKARGPLPVVNACYYVQQAALGLQHAFEKGMVHRDIKPQNLILARGAKRQTVKVLDFGLAKLVREKRDDTGLTGAGKMLGTPDYIAPEQMLDAAHADIRADIYSLGCTLYYLLTGRAPFSGNSLFEVLQAHQSVEAKPLHLVRSDVPRELSAVVEKMMAKDPAKRYQTPAEVVRALLPLIRPGEKGTKPEAEETENMPAVRAVTVAEAAPVTDEQRRRPTTARPAAARKPPAKRKRALVAGGVVAVVLIICIGLWASGVFRVKTKDGTIVAEVETDKSGGRPIPARSGPSPVAPAERGSEDPPPPAVPDKAVSVPIVAAELPPAKAEAATAAGPAPFRIEGAIEGEQMKIIRKSGGFEARPQGMAQFPTGKWSGNSQLLVKPRQQGEWVDLELPVAAEGTYRIVAYLTRAPDYGIIQFSLAGKPLGQPIDGFHSAGVASAEAVDLGTVKLKQGSATLRVETVDRNEKSVGVRYAWGLDCLVLTPAPDSPAPDEPDPIKDSLEEAKATFQSELEKLRSQLLENLDKAEEKARQSGNKKLVDQIKAERAVFEKEGKLPRAVATSDYQQKKSKARATLVAAYLSAVTAYSRAKMDARAEAVESERKRFEQDLPLDAFQPGSVWRGKTDITVIGTTEKHSTAATLIVLERNGSSFKARFEDGTAIREIRGTIDKGAIGWRATNVTAIQGGQGHNTGGKLRGTAIVLGAEWIRPKDKKGVVAVTKLQLENR